MIVGGIVKKILPIVFRKLMIEIPALKKLDKILKYVEDDNELDDAIKTHTTQIDVLKGQIIALNREIDQLNRKGKK